MSAFIKMREMLHICGISRNALYERITEGSPRFDPKFPQPKRMNGPNAKCGMLLWSRVEVEKWLASFGALPVEKSSSVDAQRELERLRDGVLRVEKFFESDRPITAREELRDLARSITSYRKHFAND